MPNKQDKEPHIIRFTSIVNSAINPNPVNQGQSVRADRLKHYLRLL